VTAPHPGTAAGAAARPEKVPSALPETAMNAPVRAKFHDHFPLIMENVTANYDITTVIMTESLDK
jgi:hypothetical protein